MTDPKRWIDDGAPGPVRELLMAAREEQPGAASTRRTLVALGVGGALSAGAESAAGAAANGATSVAAAAKGASAIGFVVKWGLVGAVTAVAVGVVGLSWRPGAPSAPPPVEARPGPRASDRTSHVRPGGARELVPAALVPSSSVQIASAGAGSSIAPEPPAPTPPALDAPPAAGARSTVEHRLAAAEHEEASVMLEEVAAIDRARAAVARGDAAAAITELDAYASRFRVRRFEPEALYLRMEALGRAGDVNAQRRTAEHLLATFPTAPQAARARAVLGTARSADPAEL